MNHSKQLFSNRALIGLLALIVSAIIALFVALSFFDYPSADDFCYATKSRHFGFIGAQEFWYKNWSGRYTLNFAYTTFSLLGDIFKIYHFPPIILLLSTWLGFCFMVTKVSRGKISKSFIFLTGGICTVLFISGTPNIAQTFYWPGGSFTYQIPNVLLLFLLGLLIWRETTAIGKYTRILIFFLSSLLTIIIIGANEISLLLTSVILFCGTIHALWTRRDSRVFWAGLLLIAIGAALVSVLAPGNYERYATLDSVTQLRLILTPGFAMLLYPPWVILRLLYWLSNLGLWASALIVLVITFPIAKTRLYSDGNFKRSFLIFPALWIIMIFVLNGIGFLINRYPLPDRAESVVWLLFLLGWYPSFIILAHFTVGQNIPFDDRRLIQPAIVLLMISLLGSPNIFEAYKDVYRGYRYAKELRVRFDAIQAAKNRGETEIIVGSISKPPLTLFAAYLETDPGDFKNQCMSEYFEVKSIRLGSPAQ
ncbi:MAG: DUF6056 family protein [Candidatus Contendobacter sp.]|nr:DUF6056 family protein [Candidatus Contendobacter sp.]MDS4059084.1 DUF6056 family protein [Candidatus Contendobacter sp.]